MLDKLTNKLSDRVYSATGAESWGIPRASNNPKSFYTAFKPLIAHMNKQGASLKKINSFVLKIFNKHQVDCNDVCQSKQILLNLVF